MRTVTTSAHVLRLAAGLLEQRGVAPLTEEQARAVTDAVDRWYGIPLAASTGPDSRT